MRRGIKIEELELKISKLKERKPNKKLLEKTIGIDGTTLYFFEDDYLLEHEGSRYVSVDFIMDFYGAKSDNYYNYMVLLQKGYHRINLHNIMCLTM